MKVFISHSNKDKNAIDRIARELSKNDLQVWLGAEQITPGEAWAEKVSEGIESSDAVLVIISRNKDESRFQTSEIAFAIAAQKRGQKRSQTIVSTQSASSLPYPQMNPMRTNYGLTLD